MLGLIKKSNVPEDFAVELEDYGIGYQRSLTDYWKLLDVDLNKKKANSHCKENEYKK